MSTDPGVQAALTYAQKAAAVADGLKAGTHDAVAALALTSIAHSLAVLAADRTSGPTTQ